MKPLRHSFVEMDTTALKVTTHRESAQAFDRVHRLGFDRGFLRLLGDFMITVAILVITNSLKSISCFWSCGPSGLRCSADQFSVFCLAIACSAPRPMTHSI
jgi:hypothetical protein